MQTRPVLFPGSSRTGSQPAGRQQGPPLREPRARRARGGGIGATRACLPCCPWGLRHPLDFNSQSWPTGTTQVWGASREVPGTERESPRWSSDSTRDGRRPCCGNSVQGILSAHSQWKGGCLWLVSSWKVETWAGRWESRWESLGQNQVSKDRGAVRGRPRDLTSRAHVPALSLAGCVSLSGRPDLPEAQCPRL